MLIGTEERSGQPAVATLQGGLNSAGENTTPNAKRSQFAKMLRLEWLGQTAASLCWIFSVFAYGISSTGDWLQLGAASAWLVANIAAVAGAEAD